MHGLIIVCMIPGAMPFEKRTCMINADLMAIGHVSGSHQFVRVLHEVHAFCILGHRLHECRVVYVVM